MNIRLCSQTNGGRLASLWRASIRLVLGLTFLGAAAWVVRAGTLTLGSYEVDDTRLLAQFKEHSAAKIRREAVSALGSSIHREFVLVPGLVALEDANATGKTAIQATDAQARRARLLQRMDALKNSGLFEYVEPDYIVHTAVVPTDTAFVNGTLWGLRNIGQNAGKPGADVGATAAWDLTTGSTNVIVAVIDTGIWYTHRDLTNQLWHNPATNSFPGFTNDLFGINAITGTGDPKDDNGHGTHVSGTIGAQANNAYPMVGVTWHVQLMGCKFLSAGGSGRGSDAITCIDYAVFNKARILNNSWGGGGFSGAMFSAIDAARRAGVLFVAAAGNAANNNDNFAFYPASYQLNNVISVAALDRNDNLAFFSNFGLKTVHLGAPGVEIFSCLAGNDTAYAVEMGTSMAAPHVSGVAALILSLFPAADLNELRQRLLLGTVPVLSLNGNTSTGGRVNAYNSLTISGAGILALSADPPSGSAILSGSAQPIFVKASDLFGVNTATVNGSIAGITNLHFLNDGVPPDVISNDATYSAMFQVPVSVTNRPITLLLTGSAPDKYGATNVPINYIIVPPPPNDFFTNAIKAPAAGTIYLSNNRFATIETNEPVHAGQTNQAGSLWWAWTAATDTNVLVDTTGSAGDVALAVYTGNLLTNLAPIVSTNSNLAIHQPALVRFDAQANHAYRIVVASSSTNTLGSVQLRIAPGGHVDVTPPEVFVSFPQDGMTVLSSVVQTAGSAFDPAPDATGVSEVLVSVNGGIGVSAYGTTSWMVPSLLQPGANTLQVTSVDMAGNFSQPQTFQVVYLPPYPTNDFFVNAAPLTGVAGTASGSTTNASKEVGEPDHAGNAGGKSLWWSFTAPADGVLTLSTTNSTFDTLLGLYTGTAVDALTTIASNDDAYPQAPLGFSQIIQAVSSNQTYYIAVDGYDAASGTAVLHYSFASSGVFQLTVNSTVGGSVIPGSGNYAASSTVVLTATPDPSYQFDGWEGDVVSLANPLSVEMTSNLSLTARFRPILPTDGFETGDFNQLPWSSGGTLPWTVQAAVVASGQFAARSGAIGDSQTSSLILTSALRSGNGSFDYRVSSEPSFDFLNFYLDGALLQRWSGEAGWATYVFPVAAGTHTLEWRYTKDASGSAGLDAAFIDNLNLPQVVPTNSTSAATLQLLRQTDGTFLLGLLGQTNQQYVVQGSTNLVNWLNYSTNIAASGYLLLPDPAGGVNRIQFYRAYVPQ